MLWSKLGSSKVPANDLWSYACEWMNEVYFRVNNTKTSHAITNNCTWKWWKLRCHTYQSLPQHHHDLCNRKTFQQHWNISLKSNLLHMCKFHTYLHIITIPVLWICIIIINNCLNLVLRILTSWASDIFIIIW